MVRESLADFLLLEISARAAEVFFLPDLISGLRYCLWVAVLLRFHLRVSLVSCLYQKVPWFIGDLGFLEGLISTCE